MMIADAIHAMADAAAASTPMSGIDGKSLSSAWRVADVHRALRYGVGRQACRAGGVARRIVRRLSAGRSALADAGPARLRAGRRAARRHRVHPAEFRQLSVLA